MVGLEGAVGEEVLGKTDAHAGWDAAAAQERDEEQGKIAADGDLAILQWARLGQWSWVKIDETRQALLDGAQVLLGALNGADLHVVMIDDQLVNEQPLDDFSQSARVAGEVSIVTDECAGRAEWAVRGVVGESGRHRRLFLKKTMRNNSIVD